MNLLKTSLTFFCFLIVSVASSQTDGFLMELDNAVRGKIGIESRKSSRIELLKLALADKHLGAEEKYGLLLRLVQEYKAYQYDSAFKYVNALHETASLSQDKNKLAEAKLQLIFILRSVGFYKETFDSLNSIQVNGLNDSLKVEYYEQYARAYFELSTYNRDNFYADLHGKRGDNYVDSAIAVSQAGSMKSHILKGLKTETQGNYEEAQIHFEKLIADFDLTDHQIAMVYYSLSNIYQAMGNPEKSREMLIKSAISDSQDPVKETLALMILAQKLYEEGDLDRAYLYIKSATEDAYFYGSRQRILQVSTILPQIESAKLAQTEFQRKRLFAITITALLFAMLIIGFALILFRQNKKLNMANTKISNANNILKELNQKLVEANTIKEEYIAHSFRKDSEFIHKLHKLIQSIDRKLLDKKPGDINIILRTVNLKKEKESLYRDFDTIFLKLFPKFIEELNQMFLPDDQYEIKDGMSLTSELRIFALIRLGIQDHEQIAEILEYSVRTIYNYKNKLKSKALVSNEDFEKRLMEIQAF